MRIPSLFAAAAVVLAAPALASGPRGEVQTAFGSATFDSTSVRGPNVNMVRQADGRWAGWLNGGFVTVDVDGGSVRGPNVSLGYERTKKEMRVRGYIGSETVSLTVPNDPKDRWGSAWNGFELKGTAANDDPPVPQILFALLAAL